MKFTIDYNQDDAQSIVVESASYAGNYLVRVNFSDGTEKVVDFRPFLTKSVHPSIKKCLDEKLFSTFKITDGNLNWNDYDMIFPVWDLYNGTIIN